MPHASAMRSSLSSALWSELACVILSVHYYQIHRNPGTLTGHLSTLYLHSALHFTRHNRPAVAKWACRNEVKIDHVTCVDFLNRRLTISRIPTQSPIGRDSPVALTYLLSELFISSLFSPYLQVRAFSQMAKYYTHVIKTPKSPKLLISVHNTLITINIKIQDVERMPVTLASSTNISHEEEMWDERGQLKLIL